MAIRRDGDAPRGAACFRGCGRDREWPGTSPPTGLRRPSPARYIRETRGCRRGDRPWQTETQGQGSGAWGNLTVRDLLNVMHSRDGEQPEPQILWLRTALRGFA